MMGQYKARLWKGWQCYYTERKGISKLSTVFYTPYHDGAVDQSQQGYAVKAFYQNASAYDCRVISVAISTFEIHQCISRCDKSVGSEL